jgi:hypothetical protein
MTVGSRLLSARRRGTQLGQTGDRRSPGMHGPVSISRMDAQRWDRVVAKRC